MGKVFFGGSRKYGRLNKDIKSIVNEFIAEKYLILIGDSKGADRAMQKYLFERDYNKVVVFYSGHRCQFNMGEWKTRQIISEYSSKEYQFYAIRDKIMSAESDCGFMVWDGNSKGTLKNIGYLRNKRKTVLVYLYPRKMVIDLQTDKDYSELFLLSRQK